MRKTLLTVCLILGVLIGCTPKNTVRSDGNVSLQGEGLLEVKVSPISNLGAVKTVSFVGDGCTLFADGDLVNLVDLAKSKGVAFPQKHDACAVHLKSQKLALGLSDGKVLLLDTVTTRLITAYQGGAISNSLAFSPDGTLLAIDTRATLHLLNLESGKDIRRFSQSGSGQYQFSPDGKKLAFRTINDGDMKNNTVYQYSVSTNDMCGHFEIKGTIRGLNYSSDGKLLAVNVSDPGGMTHETRLHVFDAETGRELFHWECDEYITDLVFTPDGEKLAVGTAKGALAKSGIVRIFQIGDGAVVARFENKDQILDLDISSKNGLLAAVSGTYSLWGKHSELMIFDLKTNQQVYAFKSDKFCNSCSFSGDGRFLVLGGHGPAVSIFDFKPGEPRQPSGTPLEMVQNDRQ